jgi:hypothetical protein
MPNTAALSVDATCPILQKQFLHPFCSESAKASLRPYAESINMLQHIDRYRYCKQSSSSSSGRAASSRHSKHNSGRLWQSEVTPPPSLFSEFYKLVTLELLSSRQSSSSSRMEPADTSDFPLLTEALLERYTTTTNRHDALSSQDDGLPPVYVVGP